MDDHQAPETNYVFELAELAPDCQQCGYPAIEVELADMEILQETGVVMCAACRRKARYAEQIRLAAEAKGFRLGI